MFLREASLFLTPKGTEELRSRAHKLDFAARNILFLIERGSTSANAILRRSVYPQDKVIDKLRRLMSNEFVAIAPDDGRRPEHLSLEDGISIPQARFVLADFCLDHLGEPGQELAIAIKRCTDLAGLQNVLDRISRAILDRCRERLPKLQACVREINQTNI